MSVPAYENRLLQALSKPDRALLTPHLEPIELELRQSIEDANTPIKHVYFPETGIISVVVKTGKTQIEAGLVGREGMSGSAIVLGDQRSPHDAYVQLAGAGHRMGVKQLRAALSASASLKDSLLRYAHLFMVQVSHTASANAAATIEQRLARWLLMAHDRQDDTHLQLTHEFISVMLGVRRAGVTDALHGLESKGVIKAYRGTIRIMNRKGLMAIAGNFYGVPEAEYKRVFG